jgi:cytochrome P450
MAGAVAQADPAIALREVPGDPGWPLVGRSLEFIHHFDTAVRKRYARYGEASWTRAFGERFIALLGPDANQFVFQNRGDLFASSGWEFFLANFFHRGLMLLDFDEHRMHRRIMQAAFTRDALTGYLRLMNPLIESGIAAWKTGDRLKVFDHLKALTLDLASEAFIGHPPGPEAARLNKAFLDTVRAPTDIIRYPLPFTRWRRGVVGRRILEDYFRQQLPAKRSAHSVDLFTRLCHARTDEGEQFSDDDVINHIIFVLMAAHDTSTITLTNMIYHLAKHPEWQARLREESGALDKGPLDYDGLQKLGSMTLVMKEALRLCAPVPAMPRRTTQECEFKGYRIPAGHLVQVSPWFSHTMPEYWSEPLRFDPERFGESRAEDKQHPFLFVPFGGGVHKCIGMHFGEMEVKAVLHQFLLHYRWSVPEGYEMRQDFTSLPIPKDRLPIRLENCRSAS